MRFCADPELAPECQSKSGAVCFFIKWIAMNINNLFFTVIYLKPKQIFFQIYRRLIKTKINLTVQPQVRALPSKPIFIYKKNCCDIQKSQFTFIGLTHQVTFPQAWNSNSLPKLWLYNLHYFDYIHGAEAEIAKAFLKRWINENPVGVGNGWEAYTLSQRIVNWVKWIVTYDITDQIILNSLYLQVRFLLKNLEYHILGNHLFANAKALIFAGCFFSNKEVSIWLNQGIKIFLTEMKEQIHADGGHFERSPMYHAKMLEDVLDIFNIIKNYQQAIVQIDWQERIHSMLVFLYGVSHADKGISYFNDSVAGVYHELDDLKKYAKDLGFNISLKNQTQYFSDTKFLRLVNDKVTVLADIGGVAPRYLPGHAHAETLAFEMSFLQERILVNTGLTTYDDNQIRFMERGTAAHNTLVVNQTNSSQIWKSFRVAKRANIINQKINVAENFAQATHNGYQKILGSHILHQRIWQLNKNELTIEDEVRGKGIHQIELYFHFHPEVKIEIAKAGQLTIKTKISSLQMIFDEAYETEILEGYYAVSFGVIKPNQVLKLTLRKTLPIKTSQKIIWN